MVTKMKVIMPEWMKRPLRAVKSGVIRAREFPMIHAQPELHRSALEKVRKKEKVRVAFFATHSSVWKYDGVYKLLAADPRFDPIVVVCPVVNYGKENMLEEMVKSFRMFQDKGYKVVMAYDDQTDSYLDVRQEIGPDIIFYTNPYKGLIDDRYYITSFMDTLTCYVRYGFGVSDMGCSHYDQLFYNILWKNFCETTVHQKLAITYARNNGENAVVTGYPGTDRFLFGTRTEGNVWKNPSKFLKRIVWAPHHTLDNRENLNLSCFLSYNQLMLDILDRYRERVQIAFKPHPLLKVKLYEHEGWGVQKTDNYYLYWEQHSNGQLETGDYIDLFNTSDAMILDSSSFVAEYLYCGKPSLFTMRDANVVERFNEFGRLAMMQHYHAYSAEDIVKFVDMVCEQDDPMQPGRRWFYDKYLRPRNGVSASKNIYDHICNQVFGS